jgi:ketosteroid isomerase-like protein
LVLRNVTRISSVQLEPEAVTSPLGGEEMSSCSRVLRSWGAAILVSAAPLVWGDAPPASPETASDELRAVETAFADTMAARDHEAFVAFLDEEAVFFNGDKELRGRRAVADAWAPYFDGEKAPFAWRPEVVSVLSSGGLGLTSGPVLDPEGNRIGTFNSIWRRTTDGSWKIVFDRGCH